MDRVERAVVPTGIRHIAGQTGCTARSGTARCGSGRARAAFRIVAAAGEAPEGVAAYRNGRVAHDSGPAEVSLGRRPRWNAGRSMAVVVQTRTEWPRSARYRSAGRRTPRPAQRRGVAVNELRDLHDAVRGPK